MQALDSSETIEEACEKLGKSRKRLQFHCLYKKSNLSEEKKQRLKDRFRELDTSRTLVAQYND